MPDVTRIVVVHDFLEILEELYRCLAVPGYQIFRTIDPLAAVDMINRYAPHVLLTRPDFGWDKLPVRTLAGILKLRRAEAAVVVAASSPGEIVGCSADEFVLLPTSRTQLMEAIELALKNGHCPLPPCSWPEQAS